MSDFTVEDLLTNPAGKYSRQVGARYMLKAQIGQKLNMLLKEKQNKFSIGYDRNDPTLVWIKIPSANTPLQYDVFIKLFPQEGSNSILKSNVQIYSNSPSWVFTYGYVAVKQELIIPEWADALGEAKDEKPVKTNPDMINGFDSIITMALIYLTDYLGLKYVTSIPALLTPVEFPQPDNAAYSAMYILNKRTKLAASMPRKVKKDERPDISKIPTPKVAKAPTKRITNTKQVKKVRSKN
jgi:hypothetical protein